MNQQSIFSNSHQATHMAIGNVIANSVFVHSYAGVLDRYADEIIGSRHDDYNGLEISGVCDRSDPADGEGTNCEVDNVHPQFFSVYARTKDGDSDCVADCEHYSQAVQYAHELSARYGWQIDDKFQQAMETYLESHTGKQKLTLNLIEPCITLSTGRTVFRRKMDNGAKHAFILNGAFTEHELVEYNRRLKRDVLNLN